MADSPMTLSEHLARQQTSLSPAHLNVSVVVGRIGRVSARCSDSVIGESAMESSRRRIGWRDAARL